MTPIQKLNSFFNNKMQFEREFANFGFRFNDSLKQELKELKKSNEFDKELINKYIFIQSEMYFFKSIEQNLGEFEQEINYKVNVVGQNDLKTEFIFLNIQKLIKLSKIIELISKEYPQINLVKALAKAKLFSDIRGGIQHIWPLYKRTSDEILDEIVSIGHEIRDKTVPKNVLLKLYDFEYSDVYIGFLTKTSIVINNSIQRIISENKQILQPKFSISDVPPFLIPIEPKNQKSIENENSKYKAKHYVLSYIIECHAKGEILPLGNKKKLEHIGNEIMGNGKGNTFYKRFNEVVNKDINAEKVLISIGGEDWREIIKNISKVPDTIENYLKSKKL
jgi:hypothetical protein